MTVKELIEQLKQFPQDVEVMIESSGGEYRPDTVHEIIILSHFVDGVKVGIDKVVISSYGYKL